MRWAVPLAAILLAVPAVAADDDPLSAEERAWIDAHGPIRYAPDPAYPPFEWADEEGTVEGINVDLLNRISRNLDIEFETVVYDNWTVVLEAMQAGDVDLLGSLAQTPEREAYMDFYGPYMEVGEVYYVRTDSPYTSNEDMEGKRVAVIRDYAASDWLADNRPGVIQVPVDDMTAGLEALSTGEVDAFFENIPVAGYVIRQEGFNNIKILDDPLYYSPANWGVQEGNAILISIMEKGMKSIPPGEQTSIFEYWSGYDLGVRRDAAEPSPAWLQPLMWGLGGFALIAVAWIVSLRRTVRIRTADLETLNEDLEKRVADRTAELEQANKHLDAFASTVSHDLQQPLTALRLQARVAALQAERGQDIDLSSIEQQIQRMESAIEALLDFSRASKPRRPRAVDLEPMVRRVADVLTATSDHPCRIDVDDGLQATADPALLETVLANLIGNAWKFAAGRPDAHIHIGGDGEHFYVQDNGPGFDADHMGDRIFRPFVRGDAGDVGGMGIGLATVARIVEAHGGRVWAESTPGHGATFHWTMPRIEEAEQAARVPS